MDYWCLSYKEGLEHILENDTSSSITVYCLEPSRGTDNSKLIPETERARLTFTSYPELADYSITGYRYKRGPFKGIPEFNVIRDKGVVLSVYNTKNKKLDLTNGKYLIERFFNSNESPEEGIFDGKIVEMKDAFSGKSVELINKEIEYASGLFKRSNNNLIVDTSNNIYLNVSFQVRTERDYLFKLVVEIDSVNSKQYYWVDFDLQSALTNKWVKKNYNLILPKIQSADDIVKFYIWNPERTEFLIDDLEVSFHSVSKNDVQFILNELP